MIFVQTQSLPYCGCGHPMRWHRKSGLVQRIAEECLAVRCRCRKYDPASGKKSSRPALKPVKASAA